FLHLRFVEITPYRMHGTNAFLAQHNHGHTVGQSGGVNNTLSLLLKKLLGHRKMQRLLTIHQFVLRGGPFKKDLRTVVRLYLPMFLSFSKRKFEFEILLGIAKFFGICSLSCLLTGLYF